MIQLSGRRFWFWRFSPSGKDFTPEGEEFIREGKKEKHYGVIAPEADTLYLPIIEENGEGGKVRADLLTLVDKQKQIPRIRVRLALAGKRVKFQRKAPDVTMMSNDGVEKLIEGKLFWVKGTISDEIFNVYVPVILDENSEKTRIKSTELELVRSKK